MSQSKHKFTSISQILFLILDICKSILLFKNIERRIYDFLKKCIGQNISEIICPWKLLWENKLKEAAYGVEMNS